MDKLLFDHFPKTGGTSLVSILVKIIGESNMAQVYGDNARLACERLKDAQVVAGHMSFFPGEILCPDRYSLTLLRHPVDRVISAYNFFRNNSNAFVTTNTHLAKKMDFETYLDCDDSLVRDFVSNAQTNHYSPLGYDGTGALSEEQKLAAAKSALEKYDLVGVVDDYADFVDVLCFEQKFSPVLNIPVENKTVNRQKYRDIPSHVLARLKSLNELDIELYEHAKKLSQSHRRRCMIACIEQRCVRGGDETAKLTAISKEDSIPRVQPNSIALSSQNVDFGDHGAEIVSIEVLGDLIGSPLILSGELFVCRVIFKANEDVSDLTVGIHIRDKQKCLVFGTNSYLQGIKLSVKGGAEYFVDFKARCDLGINKYTIGAALHPGTSHLQRCFHWRENVTRFDVVGQLGYHCDGAIKLYPSVQYGAIDQNQNMGITGQQIVGSTNFNILARSSLALTEFRAEVVALNVGSITVVTGHVFEIEVEVSNISQVKWPSTGQLAVCLSYHWLDSDGRVLVYDGKRTLLPCDVSPASTFRIWVSVLAPEQTGRSLLQLTLLQERVGWFDETGCHPMELEVVIVDD